MRQCCTCNEEIVKNGHPILTNRLELLVYFNSCCENRVWLLSKKLAVEPFTALGWRPDRKATNHLFDHAIVAGNKSAAKQAAGGEDKIPRPVGLSPGRCFTPK